MVNRPVNSDILDDIKVGDTISIGVASTSQEYNKIYPIWKKCRDAVAGEERIKEEGETYLPRPNGMTNAEYAGYLGRARWYGATKKTTEAYEGMLFRKDPVFSYNGEKILSEEETQFHKKFFDSVTLDGRSFISLMREVMGEIIKVNKCGVLIDYPKFVGPDGSPQEFTQYEIEQQNIKPIASIYKAEDILNWFYIVSDTKILPILFILQENIPVMTLNSVSSVDLYSRYRILYLENYMNPYERKYKQIVVAPKPLISKAVSSRTMIVDEIIYPRMNGNYMSFIPFYTLTGNGLDYRSNEVPMISDLVNMNIGHFNNSADLENELHWVGVKTAIFPGMDNDQSNIKIGGALGVPKDSEPFILEAQSDSGIADEMDKKELRMAVLGAERISQKGRYVQSAETAQISAKSETSVLGNMANAAAKAFGNIGTFMLNWSGYTDKELAVTINTDYYDNDLTGKQITEWFENVQKGNMSFDTVFWNLKRREVYPPDMSAEKEIQRIKETSTELFGLGDDKFNTLMNQIDMLRSLFGDEDLQSLINNTEKLVEVANNFDTIKALMLENKGGTKKIDAIPIEPSAVKQSMSKSSTAEVEVGEDEL